jgi:AcrR family transcriptional regulator
MSARRQPISLSRERVCTEALALVDEEGLEALTMRRLAARLDCEAMSLYRHVKDKADLLDALHAAVLGALQPEGILEPSRRVLDARRLEWRILLGGLARALRSALLRHPNVLPLFTSRPVNAPEAVATLARVQAAFVSARFTSADAERAIYVVGMFTIGHAIFEKSTRNDSTFRFGLEALLDGIERAHRPSRRRP